MAAQNGQLDVCNALISLAADAKAIDGVSCGQTLIFCTCLFASLDVMMKRVLTFRLYLFN